MLPRRCVSGTVVETPTAPMTDKLSAPRITTCCAHDNNLSEESTNQAETDAAGDVPNTTRIENNREKQSTQYLTRFDSVPTSSG